MMMKTQQIKISKNGRKRIKNIENIILKNKKMNVFYFYIGIGKYVFLKLYIVHLKSTGVFVTRVAKNLAGINISVCSNWFFDSIFK